MWWCGKSQLLATGPQAHLFPTPDATLYCEGHHVHAHGPLCLHIPIPSRASCKQPLLGHLLRLGMCIWVVRSTLGWANPGKRSIWALKWAWGPLGREFLGIWSVVQKRIGGMGTGGLDTSLHGTQLEQDQNGTSQSTGPRVGATNIMMFRQSVNSMKAGLVSI